MFHRGQQHILTNSMSSNMAMQAAMNHQGYTWFSCHKATYVTLGGVICYSCFCTGEVTGHLGYIDSHVFKIWTHVLYIKVIYVYMSIVHKQVRIDGIMLWHVNIRYLVIFKIIKRILRGTMAQWWTSVRQVIDIPALDSNKRMNHQQPSARSSCLSLIATVVDSHRVRVALPTGLPSREGPWVFHS